MSTQLTNKKQKAEEEGSIGWHFSDKPEDIFSLIKPHAMEKDNQETSPLLGACKKGLTEQAKLVIEEGCDLNTRDYDGWTPIMICCAKFLNVIALLLIEKGCDLFIKSEAGSTVFSIACASGNKELFDVLLTKKFNLHYQSRFNRTAIIEACSYGNEEIALTLVKHGCSLVHTNTCRESALSLSRTRCKNGFTGKLIMEFCEKNLNRIPPYDSDVYRDIEDIISWAWENGEDIVFYLLLKYGYRFYSDSHDLKFVDSLAFMSFVYMRNKEEKEKMFNILCSAKFDSENVWYYVPRDVIKIIFDLSMLKTVNAYDAVSNDTQKVYYSKRVFENSSYPGPV